MNFKVKTYNAIAETGLSLLKDSDFEISENLEAPDAMILRSYKLTNNDIESSIKAIARAGAGVNNVPVDYCSDQGIVVFNTPGANANAVKEIVLAGLLLSSRGIYSGANYINDIQGVDQGDLKSHIEQGKKSFKGRELKDGVLGVIGMGAIGSKVADMGVMLGMEVIGYDPAISVEAAWKLPNMVSRRDNLEDVFKESDYLTLHIPAIEETKNLVNKDLLQNAKEGLKLINFAISINYMSIVISIKINNWNIHF